MGKLALLSYPNKSHRKKVSFPEESVKLAEFFGIMLGDGGINNSWQANITLNSEVDAEYAEYVICLCTELFNTSPATRIRKRQKARVISLASTDAVDFLVDHGLSRGNKILNEATIPKWILRNPDYRRACVRGLIDTDGCLYIHKHIVAEKMYRNIGLCFSNYAPNLIGGVAAIFEEFGIIPHISNHGHSIYLYKADAVARYLDIFGTSNRRIASVFEDWRRG